MRQEYYEIYEDLYEEYYIVQAELERAAYFLPLPIRMRTNRLVRVVRDACEHAISETETRDNIRPDAKHLLMINLHQMIASPIALSQDIGNKELGSILRSDATTIIRAAKENSNDREISGHAIISAINSYWGELQASRLEIWG